MAEEDSGVVMTPEEIANFRKMIAGFGGTPMTPETAPSPSRLSDWFKPGGVAVLFSIFGILAGQAYTYYNDKADARRQADSDRSAVVQGFQSMHADILSLRTYVDDQMKSVQSKFDDGDKRREKYIPMIETDANLLSRLADRVQTIADSVKNDRDTNADTARMARDSHEALAVLKAELDGRKPGGPHGEIAVPEKFGSLSKLPELADANRPH